MQRFYVFFILSLGFVVTQNSGAAVHQPTAHPEFTKSQRAAYAQRFYASRDDEKIPQTGAETWAAIEHFGWPEAMGDFQVRFKKGRSYLTLYKKLPFYPIDMRSPNRFKDSMVAGALMDKSSIGHMSIGWSCQSAPEAKRIEGFTAQTGEDYGQQSEMMANGWGLTGALSRFSDGHLHNGFQIQRYFSVDYIDRTVGSDIQPNTLSALVIEVPTDECENVRQFVKQYALHPTIPFRNFGMTLDPLKFEGSGCGSFAAAALSKSKTFASLTDTYWRTMAIPKKIFGRRMTGQLPRQTIPPFYAISRADEYVVRQTSLVLMNWDTGETAMNLRFVDPELAIFSLRYLGNYAAAESKAPVTRYQRQALTKLRRTYNFSNKHGDDVVADDMDSGYQEIDAFFDPAFGRVASTVDRWLAARRATSDLQLVSFPFGVGVMVTQKETTP